MTSWIRPVMRSLSLLYTRTAEYARKDVIERWLTKSKGWLPGLQTILPGPPPYRQYRTYLLAKTPVLELWLLAWGHQATADNHDYPTHGCWMRVLQGTLYEEKGSQLRRLGPGDTSYQMGSDEIRRIHTIEPSYSIHIYAPKLSAS
jgi:hypothetical protein